MIIHGKENMFKWGFIIAALPLKEEQKKHGRNPAGMHRTLYSINVEFIRLGVYIYIVFRMKGSLSANAFFRCYRHILRGKRHL